MKKQWWKVGVLLLFLLFSFPLIKRILTWHSKSAMTTDQLKVLNYNVRVFNVYDHLADEDFSSSKAILQFLKESPADVICLQEFYSDPKDKLFNTYKALNKIYPYRVKGDMMQNAIGADFGVVLFSKLTIISSGKVTLPTPRGGNQIIYADVLFQGDTIRIYNVHLQSMSINDEALAEHSGDSPKFQSELKTALKQFKRGAMYRSKQVDVLCQHIQSTSYPVIVTGDINDIPLSYTYEQLSDILTNGFESKGKGLGITYNGPIPFLRIDHQFYSESLKIEYFNTLKSVRYTDHFPVLAGYVKQN